MCTHYSYSYSYSYSYLYFYAPFIYPLYSYSLFSYPPSLPSLLIRSIRTYICTPLFLLPLYLLPSIYTPSISTPLISPLYTYAFIRTYIRTPLLLSLLFLPLLLSPSICTHNMYAFFLKIFPKKIGTLKAYPKIFPKFLLIIITPPLYSPIGK